MDYWVEFGSDLDEARGVLFGVVAGAAVWICTLIVMIEIGVI